MTKEQVSEGARLLRSKPRAMGSDLAVASGKAREIKELVEAFRKWGSE
jgi:hypothetical protein